MGCVRTYAQYARRRTVRTHMRFGAARGDGRRG